MVIISSESIFDTNFFSSYEISSRDMIIMPLRVIRDDWINGKNYYQVGSLKRCMVSSSFPGGTGVRQARITSPSSNSTVQA